MAEPISPAISVNQVVAYATFDFNAFCERCFAQGLAPEDVVTVVLCRIVVGLCAHRPHDEVRKLLVETIDGVLLKHEADSQKARQ